MITREEAQKILAVLEYPGPSWPESRTELAVVLRYKLSAPEPEPVAWMHRQGNYTEPHFRQLDDDEIKRGWTEEPLYTAPPQREWQGLTADEIKDLHYGIKVKGMGAFSTEDIYRVVEAKLREKNT
jgi:hypothetical protein